MSFSDYVSIPRATTHQPNTTTKKHTSWTPRLQYCWTTCANFSVDSSRCRRTLAGGQILPALIHQSSCESPGYRVVCTYIWRMRAHHESLALAVLSVNVMCLRFDHIEEFCPYEFKS
ncbi:hypothetical protein TNCV_494391 [Trichonephila clavipes]|nr:hypothetical protein TNCV_494391 [Trichonephila clavipes]